jgi:8-amino-7-oxononanoate synthase
MSDLDQVLAERLLEIKADGLLRHLRRVDSPQSTQLFIDGRNLLNFSSNDYLGLANHPELNQATINAIQRYGTGSGASRLICGSLALHHDLEHGLAQFKGAEAALTFSSGYATALGTLPALLGKDDIVIVDRLVHACLIDGARLSGAKLRVFAHNDLNDLERILQWTRKRLSPSSKATSSAPRVLIVTESVFSMDGDQAPLSPLVDLKERYGAWLMVDEAHATGLYGPNGSGLIAASGLSGRVEVQMGTLGKALGASGGFIAGSRTLIEYLINRARSFIFSTAPMPAAAAAALAGLRLAQGPIGREGRDHLWRLVRQLRAGLRTGRAAVDPVSPIVPIMLGKEEQAVAEAERLLGFGFYVPAIRYPTVARGQARLRVTVTATHQPEEIESLLGAMRPPNNPIATASPCEP